MASSASSRYLLVGYCLHQKLEGVDGALIIFCVEEIAHRAEQLGHLIERGGNLRGMRSNQIHALVRDDQGRVILERTRALRARFERLAGFFRAVKLSFADIAAGRSVVIGAAGEREKATKPAADAKRTRRIGRIVAASCRNVCLIRS